MEVFLVEEILSPKSVSGKSYPLILIPNPNLTAVTMFDQTFENTFREITILNVKLRVNKVEDKNKATVTDKTTVMLITVFDEEATMTAQDLETRVKNSTFLNDSIISSFTSKTGCDIGICDNDTTDCKDVEGGIPKCECKKHLAKTNVEDKACRFCDSSCSATNNRFCLMEANLVPQCRCLPNFEEKDGECEACSIGFSGEDCQDNYMAIIIGVSTTGGVLLVALIGVTTYFLVRKQDSKAGHQQLISNEYSTLGNPSGGIDSGEDSGRIFPRIKTTNAADNPTDFYEGGAANRGYVPEREYRNDNILSPAEEQGKIRTSVNVGAAMESKHNASEFSNHFRTKRANTTEGPTAISCKTTLYLPV
ncbi:Muc13: Mucin-13 [Crotalus adamanteus]|uniref:Muc13: Mucin-13 n=1 Tax=Crotalus adamanteus TaxID=8729 RepID=A0AAW1CA63_CROAD